MKLIGATASIVCTLTLFALACSSAVPQPLPAIRPQGPAALHRGPLTDYVPAAGLRWLLVGRPSEIAGDSQLAKTLSPLISEARLDAYRLATGVDLRTTRQALIAGFDFSTLYVADLQSGDARVQELFERRLVSGSIVKAPHPDVRVVSGVVGQTPQTLLCIRGQLVAVSVGDPTPLRAMDGFARGKLKRSAPSLKGSALSTLPSELERAPLRFYAPGPFAEHWLFAARGLFGAAFALGIAIEPIGSDRISVTLALSGDWTGVGQDATSRLADAWQDLAESSTGRLLALDQPLSAPTVAMRDDQLRLRIEFELEPLVRGLHGVVAASTWEMLDLPRPEAPTEAPRPPQKR